jgi:hypothetical protein
MANPHTSHGDVAMSLAEKLPGGGILYQSWTICACHLATLRAKLGPPQHEAIAAAEQVEATGRAVLSVDSGTHASEEL